MQIPVCIRQRWRLRAERADKRGSSFTRTPALFWGESSEQIPNTQWTLMASSSPIHHAARNQFLIQRRQSSPCIAVILPLLSHKTTGNGSDRSGLILSYLCLQPPFLLYLIHSCVGVWTFHNSIHLSQKPNLSPLKGSVRLLTQYDSKTPNHKLLFMLSL